jgi:hypothetical protein
MRQPNVTRSWMARTSGQLSPRDMAILRTLGRLRLASGEQLHRIHFAQDSNRNRRRVLRSLWERHLIARLDRRVGGYQAGSSSHLLTLDVAGQRLIDQEQGRTRWRRPSTPGAPFVAHVLAVTELYTQLVEIDRQGKAELLDFDAEPLCWRRFASRSGGTATLKPDAFVRVGIGEYADSFFVEVDRGSESPSTLLAKMTGYRAWRRPSTASFLGCCLPCSMSGGIRWWLTYAAACRPSRGCCTERLCLPTQLLSWRGSPHDVTQHHPDWRCADSASGTAGRLHRLCRYISAVFLASHLR